MTPKDFNNLFHDTMMALETLVDSKGKQYTPNENRLYNFDRASSDTSYHSDSGYQMAPIQACRGMWKKQYVSLMDAIDGRDQAWTQERCNEVMNDLLVYLILTKALFYRAYGWTPKSVTLSNEDWDNR